MGVVCGFGRDSKWICGVHGMKKGFIFVCICLLLGGCAKQPPPDAGMAQNTPLCGKTVLLDAGHGGDDPGAVGTESGVGEAELNLDVTLELKRLLELLGATVQLTRADENGLYNADGSGGSRKNQDMANRGKLIRQSGADVFVSIHMNTFDKRQYWGTQVFYAKNSVQGELLAGAIQQSVAQTVQPLNRREIKIGDFYVLNAAHQPAVLIECGFLSNKQEETLLLDAQYRYSLAHAFAMGIVEYFTQAGQVPAQ